MSSLPNFSAFVNPAQAAQQYADLGWCVIPIRPNGKEPRTNKGVHDATKDKETLAMWFEYPRVNIAVATGKASKIFVIDADSYHKECGWQDLVKRCGDLPDTLINSSPRGGTHHFFRLPRGVDVKSSVGRIAPFVDVRGNNAYVLMPPSQIDGSAYRTLKNLPLADPPDWLVEAVQAPRKAGMACSPYTGEALSCVGDTLLHAVLASLPTSAGSNHKSIFRLCRLLKRLEITLGHSLSSQDKVSAFGEWYSRVADLGFLRDGSTRVNYETEFWESWKATKYAAGCGSVESAWQLSLAEPLPTIADQFANEKVKRLVGLCAQLEKRGEWFLGCRTAGRLLEVHYTDAAKLIAILVRKQVLQITENHTLKKARAYHFTPTQ